MWGLRMLGMFLDSMMSQMIHGLSAGWSPGGRSLRPAPREAGAFLPALRAAPAGPLALPAAPVLLPSWEPAPVPPLAPPGSASTAEPDSKDLLSDDVKLVQYTIVSVRPCEERVLPGGSGEVLVPTPMTVDNFAAWIIASYLHPDDGESSPWTEILEAERRYLRVAYRILARWQRKELECCDERRVEVLMGIRNALRSLPPPSAPAAMAPAALAPSPPPAGPSAAEPAAERAEPSREEKVVLKMLVDLGGAAATGQLVRETGLLQSQVRKAIKGLEAAGRIRRTGEGLQTRYVVVEQPPKPSRRRPR